MSETLGTGISDLIHSKAKTPIPDFDLPEGMTIHNFANAKRVIKKWGMEVWLCHEQTPFACKIIILNAGTRTSLQYHQKKEEINMILSGEGLLHHSNPEKTEIKTRKIGPGDMIHVKANCIHRIEALTQLTMMEVSTMELDDVVRLEDDWGRPDGRIAEEHAPLAP